MEKVKLLVILGTDRQNNYSSKALTVVQEVLNSREDLEYKIAKPSDFTYKYDVKDPKFTDLTIWAEGFLILTPEYNHGYPGTLKTLLDSEYDNYANKSASIIGVSDGHFGGARMIESLISVLKAIGLKFTKRDAHFYYVKENFDQNKITGDPVREINGMLDELVWLTRSLTYGRQNF